jgi:hypothetical protein
MSRPFQSFVGFQMSHINFALCGILKAFPDMVSGLEKSSNHVRQALSA